MTSGFQRAGELYLTGRSKDLLIIKEQNVMPHELEWLAESVSEAGGRQRCGAFSIARGAEGEQAVPVMETNERDAARELPSYDCHHAAPEARAGPRHHCDWRGESPYAATNNPSTTTHITVRKRQYL